eukprot:Rhum_TRINITY_DN11386_c0_g1::Rhum_TRINITY_DN11386_c0_g1_i1::g.44289::m.44289
MGTTCARPAEERKGQNAAPLRVATAGAGAPTPAAEPRTGVGAGSIADERTRSAEEAGAAAEAAEAVAVSEATYTRADVAAHKTAEDCWIIVGSKVYDITSFVGGRGHPGGTDVLLRYAGRVATRPFMRLHSRRAKAMLADFCVGNLDAAEQEVPALLAR